MTDIFNGPAWLPGSTVLVERTPGAGALKPNCTARVGSERICARSSLLPTLRVLQLEVQLVLYRFRHSNLQVLLRDLDGILIGHVLREPTLLFSDGDVVPTHLAFAHEPVIVVRPVLPTSSN